MALGGDTLSKQETIVDTQLGLHDRSAEQMTEIIQTMTGEAIEWRVSHGHYIGLEAVSNMRNVRIHFYSKHVKMWSKGRGLTEEEMDELRTTLKKSRRWKYRLVDKFK